MRTEQNDNDKAKKYFRDPAEILREKNAVLRGSENEEGNALVEKLKAQSEENKEKNRLMVELKTFENDQVRQLYNCGTVAFGVVCSLHVEGDSRTNDGCYTPKQAHSQNSNWLLTYLYCLLFSNPSSVGYFWSV